MNTVHRLPDRQGYGTAEQAGKTLNIHMKRMGKSIEKRTASGRAGLIEENTVNGTVPDTAVFHILSADVKDGADIWAEITGTSIMGHSFYFTCISMKRTAEQSLSVTGNAGTADPGRRRHAAV